ncbi:hypothetical protein MHK_005455 [Candidatus Magnetomorum sp. HK-1]|nr:hypothetical protein MHK_005455 [Candidatus Magnetomorum sp. HK-1]
MIVHYKIRTNLFQICFAIIFFLTTFNVAKAGHFPIPIFSPYSCDYLGLVRIDGVIATPDTEVAFFDSDNVLCGLFIVQRDGEYGIVHIYGDDPDTLNIDEGASQDDILKIRVWDNVNQIEYSGEHLNLTGGYSQNGSFFSSSSVPPIWKNQMAFILNIDTKSHFSAPTATPYISNYIGNITIYGERVEPGDEIGIFDPDGILCGHFRIQESGKYGIVQVYGDNPATIDIDEGAKDNDLLTFKIWDKDLAMEWQSPDNYFFATDASNGFFNASPMPPIWTKDTGYILNITISPVKTAEPAINTITNKSTVSISWNEGSFVKGYSWVVNQSTDTSPDAKVISLNMPTSINLDQGEGNYYIHVRILDMDDAWSNPFHYGPWQLVENQIFAPIVTGDSLTNNVRPTWTWQSAGGSGTGVYRFQLNSENDNTWTETQETKLTPQTDLESEISHVLYVQEKDIFDNWSESGNFSIQIDRIPPTAPIITTDGGNGPGIDYTVTTSSITLTGTCDTDTFEIYVNNYTQNVSYLHYHTEWTYTANLLPGSNLISVKAVDSINNISLTDEITVYYDDHIIITDSDNDGLPDSIEITYGTDIHRPDTDEDGLNDGDEVNIHRTSPIHIDSDNDGVKDGREIVDQTDPNDQYSYVENMPPERPTAWIDQDDPTMPDNVWIYSSDFKDSDKKDAHAKTYWKIKRADWNKYNCPDYPSSFNFVATNSGPLEDLKQYLLTGLISGFQYVYMVGYEDSGSTYISWSDEYLITVGGPVEDKKIQIKPGIELSDYQMVSFVQWIKNPIAVDVLGNEIWEKYGKSFKIGTYNPLINEGGYVEYGENLKIEPGKSYWFLAADGYNVSTTGVPVSTSHDIYVKLTYNTTHNNGWNMIACPNSSDYFWEDVEIFVTNENGETVFPRTSISELDENNSYIFKFLWRWEDGDYNPDTKKMIRYKGYWVNVKTEKVTTENVYLIFPEAHQNNLSTKKQNNLDASRLRQRNLTLCGTPPLPIDNEKQIRTVNAPYISGCFIGTIYKSLFQ